MQDIKEPTWTSRLPCVPDQAFRPAAPSNIADQFEPRRSDRARASGSATPYWEHYGEFSVCADAATGAGRLRPYVEASPR